MAFEIKREKEITIVEAKRILESKRELNELQRRTLDYASKFSKLDPEAAEELARRMAEKFELERGVVVQIVNCMPESMEEIRTFLGRERILPTATVRGILELLNEYRKT
ncbi:TPA: hypothetical protein EYP12_00485 [Candidatus Bipolaricaulota bacterium]|nr:hypothetical protein [Candidatus Bipolaricaulota bacterium]